MPATPLACAPMLKKEIRGKIEQYLGGDEIGHIIYRGNQLFSVSSGSVEALSTVMLSAIAHRGDTNDTENISRLCRYGKFWRMSNPEKKQVLTKLFDMDKLFGEFTSETLPSRYLRTYCPVEKCWERPPWKEKYAIKP